MNTKLKTILTIFISFLKIGTFTFGGGYAMIPLIQNEVVEKHKWITDDDILEIVAIAESTPGPIAINAATFGVVLPSFVIIFIISSILREFENMRVVQYAFNGIRAGVLALIIKALWSMYKQCPKNVVAYIVMSAAFILTALFNVNVLIVIIGCAAFGLITSTIAARRHKA